MKGDHKMKKLVSALLVLAVVLTLSTVAFADCNNGIYITKNPTDEVRSAGGKAWFVTRATGYSSIKWIFIAPDGTYLSVQEFRNRFPYATVSGESDTTLTISNVNTDMNGWRVFCAFSNSLGTEGTTAANLYVSAYVAPNNKQTVNSTSTYYVPVYWNEYSVYVPAYQDPYVEYSYDEYGAYVPAHPDADIQYSYDEYGAYVPAHPDVDVEYLYDEYGAFIPAHPSADIQYSYDEYGAYVPAHPTDY